MGNHKRDILLTSTEWKNLFNTWKFLTIGQPQHYLPQTHHALHPVYFLHSYWHKTAEKVLKGKKKKKKSHNQLWTEYVFIQMILQKKKQPNTKKIPDPSPCLCSLPIKNKAALQHSPSDLPGLYYPNVPEYVLNYFMLIVNSWNCHLRIWSIYDARQLNPLLPSPFLKIFWSFDASQSNRWHRPESAAATQHCLWH